MKYFLKSFFIVVVFLSVFSFTNTAMAGYTRSEEYIEGSNCPEPGDPGLVSICGVVTQTMPVLETFDDGGASYVAQRPVEGVSVYLYQCDNNSPTCLSGNSLVHPFSSTSTNSNGMFHLVAKKVDDPILLSTGETPAQSKRAYLVFSCGSKFAGIQVLHKTHMERNLTEIVQEVNCPNSEDMGYVKPPSRYTMYSTAGRLAAQMGVDDKDYPQQIPEEGSVHVAAKSNFEEIDLKKDTSAYLNLTGADPRFTSPSLSGSEKEKFFDKTLTSEYYPNQGAWWSLDCLVKYGGEQYDGTDEYGKAGEDGGKWLDLCAVKKDGTSTPLPMDPNDYEKLLYEDDRYVVQHLLPNIPPKEELLFYKEFSPRQDLVNIYQDPSETARFNGTHFANCLGSVDFRIENTDMEQTYIDCELLKKCGGAISEDCAEEESESCYYRNKLTYGGPASGLANPASYESLIQEAQADFPVCLIAGEDKPVKLGEIQPPTPSDSSAYRLDKSYWSPELLLYIGNLNTAQMENAHTSSLEASFPRQDSCNSTVYVRGGEASGVPTASCSSVVTPSQGEVVYGNNSGQVRDCITSGLCTSIEAFTNYLSNPVKTYKGTDEELTKLKKEYEEDLYLSGVGYTFSFNEGTKALALYSRVNSEPEKLITSPAQDSSFYENNYFINTDGSANSNHYPFEDLKIGAASPAPSRDGETRTPYSSIYMTTAAWNRQEALKYGTANLNSGFDLPAYDKADSLISTAYGHGIIDWSFALDNKPGIIEGIIESIKDLFSSLDMGSSKEKSYFDRENAGATLTGPTLVDSLTVEGFAVNEENFKTLFPLPSVYSVRTTPGDAMKSLWGSDNKCYPWLEVSLPDDGHLEDNEACNTWKREPKADGGSENTGWSDFSEGGGGISRTCRVDYCKAYVTEVEVANCDCTRTAIPTDSGGILYSYNVSSCDIKSEKLEMNPGGKEAPYCGNSEAEMDAKQKFAVQQKSCYTESCIKEMYEEEIKEAVDNTDERTVGCNEKLFRDYDPTEPSATVSVGGNIEVVTPAGGVSYAGPNRCDGNLFRDSQIRASFKEIPETIQGSSNPDEVLNKPLNKTTMDSVPLTSTELMKAWANPAEPEQTNFSGRILDTQSSIRQETSEGNGLSNVSVGHETMTAGDSINGAITRRRLSSPIVNRPAVAELGKAGIYNPLYFHCVNNTILGSSGVWPCLEIKEPPNPEVIEIDKLKVSNGCGINYENPECKKLILGSSPDLEFSDTFVKIIGSAGTKFNVPGAVILSYLKGIEGSGISETYEYSKYWTKEWEDLLYNISAPWYGGFDFRQNCDDLQPIEQGPYDWILSWFGDALNSNTELKPALDELSKGRSETASRCNFLDATYATAASLGSGGPGSCNWTWDEASAKLMNLTFGIERKGGYETNTNYAECDIGTCTDDDCCYPYMVFEACKTN